MDIIVRTAILEDLPTLLDFEQQLIAVERPMDISLEQQGKINYYDIAEFIRMDTSQVFVANKDDEIVGSGYGLIKENKSHFSEKKFGHVGFMYVKDAFRGRGISGLILEAIFNWFKTQNIRETRLQVYPNNPGAIKAYKKVGFKENLIEMLHYLD